MYLKPQTFEASTNELRQAILPDRMTLIGMGVFSAVVNILMLTGPLFMLQIYDRVLASGSVPTLVGLAILAVALYLFQAVIDGVRSRILLRMGERFDRRLSLRVHDAVLRLPLLTRQSGDGLQPLRDLDNIRGFLSSPGPTAFLDLPWIPLYLGICFLFHFWLGITALVGGIVLIALTALSSWLSKQPTRDVVSSNMLRNGILEASRRNAEVIDAMGLGTRLADRWGAVNTEYLAANRKAADLSATLGGAAKAFRMILQSTILAVGAWLTVAQEVTPGVMIASSIMMGRALAPVDLAIASWKPFLMARQSWDRLKSLLGTLPATVHAMELPAPRRELRAEGVTIIPPGGRRAVASGINFSVSAGTALGIIGPSGSGKSTVVRALVGVWQTAAGKIRIDNATFDQWSKETLGWHIGYMPQGVELFDGTIAENIARFDENPSSQEIVAAAEAAGVHDLILRLENGYDTRIGESGSALSAGQRQRVGLARALYRKPFLIVLDEPNANLDAEGEAAVVRAVAAVKARGGIAVVVAHRPGAMSVVDQVLVLDGGRQKAFGPKDEILSRVLRSIAGTGTPRTPGTTGAGIIVPADDLMDNQAANGPHDSQ